MLVLAGIGVVVVGAVVWDLRTSSRLKRALSRGASPDDADHASSAAAARAGEAARERARGSAVLPPVSGTYLPGERRTD
ncbi:hypothetical protein QWY28_21345 [Nocardioides sp. SOB77]|uniref:Uncharacterized protein n=1 Tax=Nocardioides oceani TaxID=3058369 RepID=A0ABT8FLH6_9ACTN|nr:hypothetical protein [Nocardioides oceani]MDN4175523.1 hypothetical protein [Nocardioides oceani]